MQHPPPRSCFRLFRPAFGHCRAGNKLLEDNAPSARDIGRLRRSAKTPPAPTTGWIISQYRLGAAYHFCRALLDRLTVRSNCRAVFPALREVGRLTARRSCNTDLL